MPSLKFGKRKANLSSLNNANIPSADAEQPQQHLRISRHSITSQLGIVILMEPSIITIRYELPIRNGSFFGQMLKVNHQTSSYRLAQVALQIARAIVARSSLGLCRKCSKLPSIDSTTFLMLKMHGINSTRKFVNQVVLYISGTSE